MACAMVAKCVASLLAPRGTTSSSLMSTGDCSLPPQSPKRVGHVSGPSSAP